MAAGNVIGNQGVDKDTMLRIMGAHLDAMNDPMHPLANDPITGFLQDLHANSPHVPDRTALVNAVRGHIDAAYDPNHSLASHDVTAVISQLRNAVSALPGVAARIPAQQPAQGPMAGGPQMFPMQPNLSNNPANPGFSRVPAMGGSITPATPAVPSAGNSSIGSLGKYLARSK